MKLYKDYQHGRDVFVCCELHTHESTAVLDLTTNKTYYRWTAWTNGGICRNMDRDIAAGTITVKHRGIYLVIFSCSFSGSANMQTEFGLGINGVVSEEPPHAQRMLNSTGDVGSASAQALVELSKGDVCSLKFASYSGNTKTVTLAEGCFTMMKVD